jgi:hypothetical protein
LVIAPVIIENPALSIRPNGRPALTGLVRSRISRPSRNRPSRSGVEEIERGPARRGVDDDQVPLVRPAQLPELLHRHVLLGAGEAGGQRLVERVGQDLRRPGRVGVRLDDLVERALHVEHHRVQAAARLVVDPLDQPGGVVEGAQAHRLGQPAGRVDGQHADLAPALRRPQPDRGRRRRLPDAAGAAADDDPDPPVVDDPIDVKLRVRGHGHARPPFAKRRAAHAAP